MNPPTPEKIRTLRKSAGLLQKEYGALIYTPMRSIQNWEAGRGEMHPGLFELSQIKIDKLKVKK